MHEGSIARNIIDYVQKVAEENHINTVKKIVVKLGKLHAVVPDALLFFFDIMKKEEKIIEKAVLHLEEEEIVVRCKKCGNEFSVDDRYFVCPACGSPDTEIIKGGDILIVSVEGE